ncbi:MAG: FAD-dependent oxidoreductase [Mycoplasma sp.]|nr:FAD-dependent oxidoreductase [Mycoplasma sp.]
MKYDLLVIGAGPGGMTASIYASRSNLKTAIIEKGAPGGKMVTTFKIENYPGFSTISGPDLAISMFNQVKENGVEYKYGEVKEIKNNGPNEQIVILKDDSELYAKKVIIATGMVSRIPDINRIEEYNHKGISYCAICDGPLYKGEVCGIIGGGNSAIEEASYLASSSREVHVFVFDDFFHADAKEVDLLKSKENVTIHMKSKITKLIGDNELESIKFLENGEEKEMQIKAIFPYIGYIPVSDFVSKLNITNKNGFIKTDEFMQTSKIGIYAIGDIRSKDIRQITTACSDGTIAAKKIINEL